MEEEIKNYSDTIEKGNFVRYIYIYFINLSFQNYIYIYIYIKFIEPIGSFGKTEAPPAYTDLFPNNKSVKIQIEKTCEKYGPIPSSTVAVPLTLCDIIHKPCRFNV